jgi:beta-N-acetylhexosaminidase
MRDWIQRHILGSAAGALVVLVVLIGWVITAVRSSGDDHTAAPAATRTRSAAASATPSADPPPISDPPPSPDPPPACGHLTPAEQAGQLVMIGTPVGDARSLAATVTKYHLGGVFLAGRSDRTAAALRADIAALQAAAGIPLLVALDQEGGNVQTLKGPDFPVIPPAQTLGAGSATTLSRTVADAATRLRGIGVNLDLAPVADTVPAELGERNPPIGYWHRQYGSDPAEVAADVRTAVTASQKAGVLTTVKHFPGLGRTLVNTDTSTGATDGAVTPSDPYLKPFAAGIAAGTAAVMVSSASYPKLDRKAIAAFSAPVITGLLRQRMGFRGLVVSDDLGAATAVKAVSPGDRAVRFVRAGGDLVLSIRPEDAAPMTAALQAEAKASPAFAQRVADAAGHVQAAKKRAGLKTCG